MARRAGRSATTCGRSSAARSRVGSTDTDTDNLPDSHADGHADSHADGLSDDAEWHVGGEQGLQGRRRRHLRGACGTRAGSRRCRFRGGSRRTSWCSGCRSDPSASRRTPSLRQDPRGLGVDGVPGRSVVALRTPADRDMHGARPPAPGLEPGRALLPRRRTSRTRSCPPTARGGPPPTREAAPGPMRAEDRGCAGRGRRRCACRWTA